MSQTIPASCELGPAYAAQAIGYRILNLDRTTYSAFSTTGVAETAVVGTYIKSGGATAPDAGGYIVWGTSGTDIIEDDILPAVTGFATPTNVTDAQNTITAAIDALNDLDSTAVQSAAAAALVAYDPPTKAELDSAVAPLATQTSVNTLTTYVDTEVAAIKAKTDNLPSDPADASDIAASLTTITGYIDTEVAAILAAVDTEIAAIKAVTDNLPDSGALTTVTNNVAAILADTGTDGVVVASGSKTGYSLSSAGVQAIWEYATRTLTSFGTLAADVWSVATRTITGGTITTNDDKAGYSLATDQSGVTIGVVNALGATAQAQVNTQADTALADYDAPTKAELDTAQAAIIDAVPTTTEIDTQLSNTHGDGSWEASGGLTVADIWSYATRTLTATTNNVTVVSTVSGGTITVYAKDTWRFTINSTSLTLSGYEAVAFVVKLHESQSDDESLLYVRSDSGLVRMNGAAATSGNGTLAIDSATQITVNIAITTTSVPVSRYRWWIKGFDTTPTPDTGFTLATGTFIVQPAGLQAIV